MYSTIITKVFNWAFEASTTKPSIIQSLKICINEIFWCFWNWIISLVFSSVLLTFEKYKMNESIFFIKMQMIKIKIEQRRKSMSALFLTFLCVDKNLITRFISEQISYFLTGRKNRILCKITLMWILQNYKRTNVNMLILLTKLKASYDEFKNAKV